MVVGWKSPRLLRRTVSVSQARWPDRSTACSSLPQLWLRVPHRTFRVLAWQVDSPGLSSVEVIGRWPRHSWAQRRQCAIERWQFSSLAYSRKLSPTGRFRPEAVIPVFTVFLGSHTPGRAIVHDAGPLRVVKLEVHFARLAEGSKMQPRRQVRRKRQRSSKTRGCGRRSDEKYSGSRRSGAN